MGTLVGTDKMGNKYYENNEYFLGKLIIILWVVTHLILTFKKN